MNERVSRQPRIVVNGRELTPEQIGTVVAGLNAIGSIANALDEAGSAGDVTDLRDAKIKQHRSRVNELRSLILQDAAAPSSEVVGTLTQQTDPAQAPAAHVRITVEVETDRQEAFMRLWHEFALGESSQEPIIRQRAADREQGIASLRELVAVAQRDSGQCRRIALFLAALYNGPRFPLDLTELRAIDDSLFEHAIAVLRLDHRPQKEVHCYFPDGGQLWEKKIIDAWGLDEATALHAAYLLAGFLENSEKPALRQLSRQIYDWRRDMDRRREGG